MAQDLLSLLAKEKIIAIVRGIPRGSGEQTAKALAEGGISFLEITLNTDGALDMIDEVKGKFGERIKVGAGTVLNLKMAKEAIQAGAEYIISPNLDEEVLTYGLEQGVEVWPGTMTPSEIVRAYNLGAKVVKVFPIGSLGVKYIKDLRAPLSHIPMVATGGVNLDNIKEVLGYGAVAVGLGGNLVNNSLIEKGDFEKITHMTASYTKLAKEVEENAAKS
ncbi:bifunctional 4-hydroxy-2-oxoglutarate aldolase/2-dehydro-3-deoxy-phosphogluconate aldolase [Bacillus sp. ISL-18]|uniref:bifunctional 4-hydroxy-2-oxoglutarate aldolase/2-dehydro-3-deoxy-phosphogluconate aldolase n=1 Tax=Bacillus sp. ISL-18 TaxID=2819118 RepID=UPI001BEB5C46|nr:bifunctional 4-hydroxy-2-oxoglutarate aldolase/2-dehydro-3-deoxy-phosphogluconate aldolase [Bacillus sp. ISL-18]MBT2657642.1 bifunctional 4-hydroxy-2-oxoglutarate aldolase/2-dehydro-3-deoxy-phosphogluconate aldolase [Bacillus sp. ISL-18]